LSIIEKSAEASPAFLGCSQATSGITTHLNCDIIIIMLTFDLPRKIDGASVE